MTALAKETRVDSSPNQDETNGLEQLEKIIAQQLQEGDPKELSFTFKGKEVQTVPMSPVLTEPLFEMLRIMSSGRRACIFAEDRKLTVKQVANILNVTRPFLDMLLESGVIPHIKVGRHRRINATDLYAYIKMRKARRASLDRLIQLDQEQGLL